MKEGLLLPWGYQRVVTLDQQMWSCMAIKISMQFSHGRNVPFQMEYSVSWATQQIHQWDQSWDCSLTIPHPWGMSWEVPHSWEAMNKSASAYCNERELLVVLKHQYGTQNGPCRSACSDNICENIYHFQILYVCWVITCCYPLVVLNLLISVQSYLSMDKSWSERNDLLFQQQTISTHSMGNICWNELKVFKLNLT